LAAEQGLTVSAQYVPEPTPPTKWMSEVNKMVECKYPGCGGATKPPNIYCSWMCEVDFNALRARSGKEPCPNCESALTGGRPNADLSKCVVCKGTGVV
jgi:hypothetical protein